MLSYDEAGTVGSALGREPDRNAYVELHNLIAAAEGPDAFGPEDLRRIARRRNVDLTEKFVGERASIYQEYLDHLLETDGFHESGRAVLAHLARTLHLRAEHLRPVHRRAFGKAVQEAIADGELSVEERLHLYALQHALGLDPALADGAYEVMAREALLVRVARVLSDGRLSPDEADRISTLQRDLSVSLPTRVQEMLDAAAEQWRQIHTALPTTETDMALAKEEVAHFQVRAAWHRVSPKTLRMLFPSESAMRAALRDPAETRPVRLPCTSSIHKGRVLITSRRLLLRPTRGEASGTGHAALTTVSPFANGTYIGFRKADGLFIQTHRHDADLFRTLFRVIFPTRSPPSR